MHTTRDRLGPYRKPPLNGGQHSSFTSLITSAKPSPFGDGRVRVTGFTKTYDPHRSSSKREKVFWQAMCIKHDSPFTIESTEGVSGMYVLKLLKKDHSAVQSLFSKFARSAKCSHE